MPDTDPEQVRQLLAMRRLRQCGWDAFQAGNRRTAARLAAKPIDDLSNAAPDHGGQR